MTARRRRHQRGAAVFIVVLVLTLLTATGIFAVRSASLVTVASGYHRQAMQTAMLADYAARAAIVEVGNPLHTSHFVSLIRNRGKSGAERCRVNERVNLPEGAPPPDCYSRTTDEITQAVQANFATQVLLAAQSATDEGSLGPPLPSEADAASALQGRFKVEMHDLYEVGAVEGMRADSRDLVSMSVAITAFAQLRPAGTTPAGPWCPDETSGPNASLQALRARVTLPVVVAGAGD